MLVEQKLFKVKIIATLIIIISIFTMEIVTYLKYKDHREQKTVTKIQTIEYKIYKMSNFIKNNQDIK